MDDFASVDIDDIVKSSIDDLVKVLKVKNKLYIGYDNKQNVAIAKICAAMNQIGYEKGYKRGKSVGSHQAYNYFLKQGRWEDKIPYEDAKHGQWIFIEQLSGGYYSYKCSECQHLENVEKRQMLGNYCSYCGAKMDGEAKC